MRLLPALFLALALPVVACEEDSSTQRDPLCTPRQTTECLCGNGEKGAQTCEDSGAAYSVCSCEDGAGGSGGGSAGSGGSGADPLPGPGCERSKEVDADCLKKTSADTPKAYFCPAQPEGCTFPAIPGVFCCP